MQTNSGNHAWMFQFRPDEDAAWLRRLEDEKSANWRIIRWADETKIGDFVVFWESGPEAGLKGWGYVSGQPYEEPAMPRRRWRVPVQVFQWLTHAIPRQKVLGSNALLPSNLYRQMTQAANFRLEPEEAQRLLALIPGKPSPALDHLQSHPPSLEPNAEIHGQERTADSISDQSSVEYVLSEIYPEERFTPLARTLLREAELREHGVAGPISSTRLLLGAIALADSASFKGKLDQEAAALLALKATLLRFKEPIEQLRSSYLNKRRKGGPPALPRITSTVKNLIAQAHPAESSTSASTRVSVDALIAALLTTESGRILERLSLTGVSQHDLKREMLTSIGKIRPDLMLIWERTLGMGTLASPTPPDLTQDMLRVALLGNDNAWQEGQKDTLGADREAQAFAGLALSPHFIPPLAVGVFGDWGSGKSFFMRLVHEHIERLSKEALNQGKDAALLGRVAQIRFNAWHYVDTNLWASLVDHIFTELDKTTGSKERNKSELLFEQLTTARELTLESAERLIRRRKEQEDAARAVADSERRLQQTESSLVRSPKVYWEAVKAQLFSSISDEDKIELATAADRLGIKDAVTNSELLGEAIQELERERGRATLLAGGLRNQLGSWQIASIFVVACLAVPLALWGIRESLAIILGNTRIRDLLSESTIALSGVLSAAAGVFAEATRRTRNAVDVVQSMRDKFNAAVADAVQAPTQELKEKQDELARVTAEVAEGRVRLASTTERLSEAATEYNAGTGRARLLSFVRARAAGESYARHLGLVATVRKDFEELSDLIAAAGISNKANEDKRESEEKAKHTTYKDRVDSLVAYADQEGGNLLREEERQKLIESAQSKRLDESDSVDRIVLYIDDLDRCQPDKVAEVLQAVHLLLSFKLFVVLVAVDVRWVSRALEKNYPMLLDRRAENGAATAHDYLEKIFQVPYWVRPMNDDNSALFMRDRLYRQSTPGKISGSMPSATSTPIEESPAQLDGPEEGREEGQSLDGGLSSPQLEQIKLAEELEQATTLSAHLELSENERAFMASLARYAGASPRRLLRFLNVYQVVKASLPAADSAGSNSDGFHALMTQIAIVTSAPDFLDEWIGLLARQTDSATVATLLQDLDVEGWAIPQGKIEKLRGALQTLRDANPSSTAADLRQYSGLARRYSFTGTSPMLPRDGKTEVSAANR